MQKGSIEMWKCVETFLVTWLWSDVTLDVNPIALLQGINVGFLSLWFVLFHTFILLHAASVIVLCISWSVCVCVSTLCSHYMFHPHPSSRPSTCRRSILTLWSSTSLWVHIPRHLIPSSALLRLHAGVLTVSKKSCCTIRMRRIHSALQMAAETFDSDHIHFHRCMWTRTDAQFWIVA